ncbi:Response regulator of zinc sigma-54-dependent two-component system [Minicystis rosea]|nr:Response regulator of zinc sigma-54-dependent two-component system [Minicystis rosea]
MCPRDPSFDAETAAQRDDFAEGLKIVRSSPEITWVDEDGAHRISATGRMVIGSAKAVDVVLADAAVSRLHAEIEPRQDGLWVRDLGSKNGTFVEGILVGAARVPDGATIRCGSTVLQVRYGMARAEVPLWSEPRFGALVGGSAVMRELFAQIARAAASDATVLLQGETGTGKELVAEALHGASPRAGGPFVVVDCAALTESLLEAELFGHARGAFTGAASARLGAVEAANGGTVFIDEVGELSPTLQPKLLRVMESRTVRRLGETAYRKVDVRFVAATHRDLPAMVAQGAFREDLYFRLAVLPLRIPPLRERLDDLPLLMAKLAPGGALGALSLEAKRELQRRPWLGNVRELRNFVERALAFGVDEALSLSASTAAPIPSIASGAFELERDLEDTELPSVSLDVPFKVLRDRWNDHLEREYLSRLLARHDGNVSVTAEAAGLDRSYVHRLMRKHALAKPSKA